MDLGVASTSMPCVSTIVDCAADRLFNRPTSRPFKKILSGMYRRGGPPENVLDLGRLCVRPGTDDELEVKRCENVAKRCELGSCRA
jgi:hypothetical protein